jgi:hypothetical protein
MRLAHCSAPMAPPRLALLPGSRYVKSFPGGLFVKKFLKRAK